MHSAAEAAVEPDQHLAVPSLAEAKNSRKLGMSHVGYMQLLIGTEKEKHEVMITTTLGWQELHGQPPMKRTAPGSSPANDLSGMFQFNSRRREKSKRKEKWVFVAAVDIARVV